MASPLPNIPRVFRDGRSALRLETVAGSALLTVAILAGGVTDARAQVTAYAGGSPSNIVLSIPVTASVGGRCGFAPGAAPNGSTDVGEVNNAFTADFPFTLQCTVPFRAAVISQNGGLLTGASAASGYTNLAPYLVDLNLVGDSGVGSVSATCDTGDLKTTSGATCGFKGPATTSQGLRLNGASYDVPGSYVRVHRAAYAGASILVASNTYADALTVTLSVAP